VKYKAKYEKAKTNLFQDLHVEQLVDMVEDVSDFFHVFHLFQNAWKEIYSEENCCAFHLLTQVIAFRLRKHCLQISHLKICFLINKKRFIFNTNQKPGFDS